MMRDRFLSQRKAVHYGFLHGNAPYRVIFQAAARYYFDRDLATFERVRESLKLLPSVV